MSSSFSFDTIYGIAILNPRHVGTISHCSSADLDPEIGSTQFRMITGNCEGCGAPWSIHPLQNALAKGANECSYCRRPR